MKILQKDRETYIIIIFAKYYWDEQTKDCDIGSTSQVRGEEKSKQNTLKRGNF